MCNKENKETHIIFPCQVLKGDRVGVLVEDECEGDDEAENIETLGAQVEW